MEPILEELAEMAQIIAANRERASELRLKQAELITRASRTHTRRAVAAAAGMTAGRVQQILDESREA